MHHRVRVVLVATLVVASGVTGVAVADPPRPGTEDNGLTANESATLWSRDTDDYMSQGAYREQYGESRSAVHQLANGTDITFTRPPATAATWTRHDFADLDAGGPNTSVYPSHATLEDGAFIEDAHATVFAVQPSTRGHLEPGATPLYVAPNGTLRGFVDYRVRVPNESSNGNTTVEWSLVDHEIEAVRLKAEGETIVEQNGSHTPVLDYHLDDDWQTTLTFAADIHVRLQRTTGTDPGTGSDGNTTSRTASLTVTDTLDVAVYDLSPTAYHTTYPDGDAGVAIFQTRPWQGYTLSVDGESRVRGVWRFYTARDTDWDTLVRATRTDRTTVESDALPVFVHAYPSRIGPRAEPVRSRPDILNTWGPERQSAAATLGDHVHVDVSSQPYTQSSGIAIRAAAVDREPIRVAGLVRGVNASIGGTAASERQLRRSTLAVDVRDRTQSTATLRLELRDARTGAPIMLGERERRHPIGGGSRNGYITVAGKRVVTNASGIATVTVDDPGIYTARYHPGSWLGHEPAYVGTTATARWHPLTTIDGWFALLVEVGWQLLPFAVMFYAGQRLLQLVGVDAFQQQP